MKKIPLLKADYYDSFAEYLDNIWKNGDQPALSWFTRNQEEKRVTYHQFVERVWDLREALHVRGLWGKNIAIMGENSSDWLCSYLAITSCGSVAVCIDTEQSDDSIKEMLQLSDAAAVFASDTYAPICRPVFGGEDQKIIALGGTAEEENSLEMLVELGRRERTIHEKTAVSISPDQTASISFTSGTTGRPKLVMLSHKNILYNIGDSEQFVTLSERVFCSLPFYHTYGLTCAILGTLMRGKHLFINGDLRTTLRDLLLADAESMLTVPLMMEVLYHQMLLQAEKEKEGNAERLSRQVRQCRLLRKCNIRIQRKELTKMREKVMGKMKLLICGGASLSKELAENFWALGVTVLEGYGITECAPLVSVNRVGACKIGSVGLVLPGCEVKIQDGEVLTRGVNVMKGYYKAPELTEQVMEDGWFRTGDLGYVDRDGFLYLTGRKKNLIVFKNGKKISPEKVEELLARIPLVKEVVVSGMTSGTSADDVKLTASIYPDPQSAKGLDSYEILETLQREVNRINARLPSFQQVQMISVREKEFPKTSTKKIKKTF